VENLTGTANILWRGKYLLVAGLIMGLVGAIIATKSSTKVYQATGLIQVASDTPSAGAEVLGLQQASQDLASTYSTLITSRSFLARIRNQVGGGRYSTSDLASNVSASAVTQNTQNTNLIEITAQGSSPEAARLLAQQVSQAFVQTISQDTAARAQQQQTQLQSRITALTAQINRISPSAGAQSDEVASLKATRAALTTEMANAIATAAGREGSVEVVAPAIASDLPVKPRPLLNYALGIVLGLMVGIGAAWLRSVLDRQLHSSEEIEALTGAPLLASVPLRRDAGADDLVTREAYDLLRTNLTFLSVESRLSVLTITSSESGEGKTATAEGLAYAATRRDLQVLLIDGDLRTGALSGRLGAGGRPGLVNVVAGQATAASVLMNVTPNLTLLPAGPIPPNPPSVLASTTMANLVRTLRDSFDLIVIDSPPVGHLADAALLAALSDASILVARAGYTDRSAITAAVAALARTPAPIVGTVVFERRSLDPVYYPSGGAAPARVPKRERRPADGVASAEAAQGGELRSAAAKPRRG
jgi:non-specific protein-tyrosine kinase